MKWVHKIKRHQGASEDPVRNRPEEGREGFGKHCEEDVKALVSYRVFVQWRELIAVDNTQQGLSISLLDKKKKLPKNENNLYMANFTITNNGIRLYKSPNRLVI